MLSPPTACSTCKKAMPCECAKKVNQQPPVAAKTPADCEHDRLMRTSQWKNRTSPTIRTLNPQCQRVLFGEQCMNPSKEVHHLDADPKLFFTPSNLVALCPDCHWKLQGEPETSERIYTPTRWLFGASYPHPKHARVNRGDVRITADGRAVIG